MNEYQQTDMMVCICGQILGSRGDMEAKIEEATRQKIDEINRSVQTNKDQAMQRLLKLVCDIKPELHANFQAK